MITVAFASLCPRNRSIFTEESGKEHELPVLMIGRLGKEVMITWVIQLLTIFGVVVGAFASFISARVLDRNRWRREQVLRWDTKRLESYSDFGSAMMHYITIAYRITAELGLTSHVQPLDTITGLPELALAEAQLSEKMEQVIMLGSPEVILAGQAWRNEAWHLDRFARGLLTNPLEYAKANKNRRAAQKRFYSAVRADLGVLSGEIPLFGPLDEDEWRRLYEENPNA